jgi:hypothetical protein
MCGGDETEERAESRAKSRREGVYEKARLDSRTQRDHLYIFNAKYN